MAGPMGPSSFEIQNAMNAGGKNSKNFDILALSFGKGLAEAGGAIFHDHQMLQSLTQLGNGLCGMLFSTTGEHSSNPVRAVFSQLFEKEAFKKFADNSPGAYHVDPHFLASNSAPRPQIGGEMAGGGGHHGYDGGHVQSHSPKSSYSGSDSSGSSGSGDYSGGSSGSNHAFPAAFAPVTTAGSIVNSQFDGHVPRSKATGFNAVTPSATPGMGESRGIGV